jgi:glycine betaine/proline transport system ATP-binding protein
MRTDFPTVSAAVSLEEIFHIAQTGAPIAVVNRKGKFKGVVEQSDILASIGRLTETSSAESAASPAAVQNQVAV